jgi:hypothetical protein
MLAATRSAATICGRAPATTVNNWLKSALGAGGRWFESSRPDHFSDSYRPVVLTGLFLFATELQRNGQKSEDW